MVRNAQTRYILKVEPKGFPHALDVVYEHMQGYASEQVIIKDGLKVSG